MSKRKRQKTVTFRNVVITIQSYERWNSLPEGVTYLVYQHEMGTHEHTQAYAELKKQKSLQWLKKTFGEGHYEKRRGSQEAAIVYCKKQDTRVDGPWELGTKKQQGRRTDITAFVELVRQKKRKVELFDSMPGVMARYRNLYDDVRATMIWPPVLNRKVCLYYGKTGTGKTRKATMKEDHWMSPICNKTMWFQGYDGQRVAVLDEFTGGMKRNSLLRLLDVQCPLVEVKGGFAYWTPKKIIITSNYRPREWYEDWTKFEETYEALCRRITCVYVFKVQCGGGTSYKKLRGDKKDEFFQI